MKRKIVYVVTSGSYSDYGICAVCSTQVAAKEYMERFPEKWNRYNGVEEYEVDALERLAKVGRWPHTVEIARDGTILSCNRNDALADEHRVFMKAYAYTPGDGVRRSGPDRMRVVVEARDEKHAIKIASDMRAAALALGEWVLSS